MVVSLLHKMQAPNICFTLSLCDSNSCKSNSWRNDHVMTHWYRSRWWRSWCHAGDDNDHGASEMEITSTRWWWPYHITYIDCMWCLSFMHLILLWLTVALLDDLSLNFKIKVFSLSMHRCQSSSCRDTMWWSGVISSRFIYNGCKPVLHTQNTRVKLDEPSICRYGLGTLRPKGRAWII